MTHYKAPLRDMEFVLNDLLDFPSHYAAMPNGADATPETVTAILEEAGKFAENVLAPLNAVGDSEGCQWNDGKVTTPSGFKEAYAQYVDGGWPALSHDPAYGGQGLPHSLSTVMSELINTANWAWGMYPGLSHGAMNTLSEHGTEEQKQTYLTKLISGQWTGTMCLTEPHCGTDLGMLRTKAEPQADGTYRISGTKIFISAGDHDMAENIVHIVLARLPDAPAGTKGISLFIVPKFRVRADGSCGEANHVSCGSLEHKMGIHGNATCVLNFDGAEGFLIGPENRGLNCMFTFMNSARIGTALQGLAHAEWGFQHSLAYARERLQMRSLSGPKNPDGPADPIIVHADVRRMLMTQKVFAEGHRMLLYFTAKLLDITHHGSEEERKRAEGRLALLTPIAKAFMTETGFESANLGLQCFGGHGYIREWGMEQNVRDSRISTIYEGTTGIQALDLLGRKVLGSQGALLKDFLEEAGAEVQALAGNPAVAQWVPLVGKLAMELGEMTKQIGAKAMANPDEVGAASVDYLMYSGYVVQAYLWLKAAAVAAEKADADESGFYKAKLASANFYFSKILPRTRALKTTIEAGAEPLFALDESAFAYL
ncbi:acyl-CoA dehydrogenase C-terminal domain-containing protein [Granulosicoccaceae sp. 1_MG-2023]|nr:acyl-CoA dehydrogenase C-terminal domain-containing protein [Granulosicoccaceae sp. 1_MG-2023]